MPPNLVLDASALLAMMLGEPVAPAISAIVRDHLADGRLVVPDHFWLEVVNVLVRRHRVGADDVLELLRELDELEIETLAIDRPILLLALDEMARRGLTAYDAAYLAVAEVEDAGLLTLDADLAAAAGPRAVRVPGAIEPSALLSERPTPYGKQGLPPTWAAHGKYLAELRARAMSA